MTRENILCSDRKTALEADTFMDISTTDFFSVSSASVLSPEALLSNKHPQPELLKAPESISQQKIKMKARPGMF